MDVVRRIPPVRTTGASAATASKRAIARGLLGRLRSLLTAPVVALVMMPLGGPVASAEEATEPRDHHAGSSLSSTPTAGDLALELKSIVDLWRSHRITDDDFNSRCAKALRAELSSKLPKQAKANTELSLVHEMFESGLINQTEYARLRKTALMLTAWHGWRSKGRDVAS